ncbi:VOC family protein [Haloarcula sp. CBA1130]|uniref:VOC family protein n=1 Tax=unclassified Haloarcula TaxID=2624677 RepID=UPI001244ACAA|nr:MULTISPECIES: VOC family protein [unclassified Haloarcula]KAA9397939.1 VOC family protein [Haloarcula sp. CBA1129]KAA9402372.1 VOC family protein [Haloarcula sp. CBA1130]
MDQAPLSSETEIGRVALTVADLPPAVDFYRDVVGLHVLDSGDDRVILGTGGQELLVLNYQPDAPARDASETGLYHVAFRVPSRAALGDALQRINSKWTLAGASDHGVSEALYLSDPAGNGVEIYRDFPRASWEETPSGHVEMVTDPLDTQAVAAAGAGKQSLPAGSDVGHVHLEVSSVERAKSFYADALGLRVRATYDGAVFLAAGDYHHHIGVNVWQQRSKPHVGQGLAWFEIRLPDEATLDAVCKRLRRSDYAVSETDTGLTVRDSDDIELRLRP